MLSPDGRWRFDSTATLTNPVAPSSASPYQPIVKKFSVAFNTDKWNIVPPKDGEPPNKRLFANKSLPIYAMVISDEIPVTTAAMKDVILYNVKSIDTSPTTLLDQPVNINGKEAGAIRVLAANKGLEFIFSTYYYGDTDGNIQVTCYTAQSLFFKYESDCQQFVSGLAIK